MVVCKCRKATKFYCFVHKVPVCGECICFSEHQICVVRTYSEWVIDGEYDWPPKCCQCQAVLEEGSDAQTTRLGCLHVIHTSCLVSHIKGFPPHTAPAGYVCPACSTSIWPPKSVKDPGSLLHSKLKEAIMQTGLEKNVFGNLPVSMPAVETRAPPPAFASDPLVQVGGRENAGSFSYSTEKDADKAVTDISMLDGPNSGSPSSSNTDHNFEMNSNPLTPAATTRKGAIQVERQNSEVSYNADDEDGNKKKYTRRGPIRHKFLRKLIPFWSNALPTLPVTAPSRKDPSNGDNLSDTRKKHHRSSRTDPRRVLLIIAIMACLATMVILYYRIAQRDLSEKLLPDEDELQQ